MRVILDEEGQADFDGLPSAVKARVIEIARDRLPLWPNVSGAKALRGDWKGHYRIRTGDYRIIFRVVAPDLIVVRIQHRSKVYED
jgi:mRNA interferase RelE/StbE